MQIETLSGQLVGFIGSHSCNLQDGTFSYGVGIHPEHQRKGYAAEAVKLLLRFFFTERRYQKVTANAYSFNEASIWLHEKLGFQLEGRLRRMKYAMGQHHDELHFGMTREEFVGKYLDADNQLK
jgi:RimJ/RimL family protein N-acetyltransferase